LCITPADLKQGIEFLGTQQRSDIMVLRATISHGRLTASFRMVIASQKVRFSELEHDPEKWKPVFRKDHAQTKRRDHDPIPFNRIMI
jgi:hypothetical protein